MFFHRETLAPPGGVVQSIKLVFWRRNVYKIGMQNTTKPYLSEKMIDGIPEVTCEAVQASGALVSDEKIKLIDVRRPDEFNAELGHIKGAKLITLGPDLIQFLETSDPEDEIVFVCRSGGRSAAATAESRLRGFKHSVNMTGGMIRWNQSGLPIEQN